MLDLARACRLSLTRDELLRFTRDLESLEELAATLCTVENRREEQRPANPLSALRSDEAIAGAWHSELLAACHEVSDGYIAVPRTVEES